MLFAMRTLSLLVCVGLVVGCGSGDDESGTAGSGASGGVAGTATNGGAGPSAGGRNSGGGRASSAGSTSGGGASTGGQSGGGVSQAGSAGATTDPSDPYGDARTRCVDRTNELRATKGLAPIPRLASAEPCADGQAKSDSETGKAHGAFDACLDQVKGWKGVAQNECPNYGSVEDTLTKCLDAMWAEGPGGGHYDNMTGNSTDTACGIYTTPAGKVWLVQDFWTK